MAGWGSGVSTVDEAVVCQIREVVLDGGIGEPAGDDEVGAVGVDGRVAAVTDEKLSHALGHDRVRSRDVDERYGGRAETSFEGQQESGVAREISSEPRAVTAD